MVEPALESGPPPELDKGFEHAPDLGAARNYLHSPPLTREEELTSEWEQRIRMARQQRETGALNLAFSNLQVVLDSNAPEQTKKTALLEMAFTHQKAENWPDALKAYGIFLKRYPEDPGIPEVLLRQGLLYREIGAPTMALAKFHSVMTTALNLNMDKFQYYRGLVLMAQTQIAETYYQQGNLKQAGEKYEVLLKSESALPNRDLIHYMLILCLAGQDEHIKLVGQAQDFLRRNPESSQSPHIRYLLAGSLKQLGRNAEALNQVLALMTSSSAQNSPEWRAWQKRTGNEIGNQLYQSGDLVRALDVYLNMADLDQDVAWQLPVLYQVALIYERLEQPSLAVVTYQKIIDRESELTDESGPSLHASINMAKWRRDFLNWKLEAEKAKVHLQRLPDPINAAVAKPQP